MRTYILHNTYIIVGIVHQDSRLVNTSKHYFQILQMKYIVFLLSSIQVQNKVICWSCVLSKHCPEKLSVVLIYTVPKRLFESPHTNRACRDWSICLSFAHTDILETAVCRGSNRERIYGTVHAHSDGPSFTGIILLHVPCR